MYTRRVNGHFKRAALTKLLKLIYLSILGKKFTTAEPVGSARPDRSGASLVFHQPPVLLCVPNPREAVNDAVGASFIYCVLRFHPLK